MVAPRFHGFATIPQAYRQVDAITRAAFDNWVEQNHLAAKEWHLQGECTRLNAWTGSRKTSSRAELTVVVTLTRDAPREWAEHELSCVNREHDEPGVGLAECLHDFEQDLNLWLKSRP
jgi:hypothetical protein